MIKPSWVIDASITNPLSGPKSLPSPDAVSDSMVINGSFNEYEEFVESQEHPEGVLSVDHCAAALEQLMLQFKGKDKLAALICSLAESMNELEKVFNQLETYLSISTARGRQLDLRAAELDLIRPVGYSDNRFRNLIRAMAVAVNKNGDANTILAICIAFDGGFLPDEIIFRPAYPKGFEVEMPFQIGQLDKDLRVLASILSKAANAGTRFNLTGYEASVSHFGFDDDPNSLGWSDDPDDTSSGTWMDAQGKS